MHAMDDTEMQRRRNRGLSMSRFCKVERRGVGFESQQQRFRPSRLQQSLQGGAGSSAFELRTITTTADDCSMDSSLTSITMSLAPSMTVPASPGKTASKRRVEPGHKVQFGIIQIRHYEQVLGDNPSCSSGAPVSIGWAHENELEMELGSYEELRPPRRPSSSLTMDKNYRRELLLEWGVRERDIASAVRKVSKTKHQRRRSINNYSTYDRLEVAIESACRKISETLKKSFQSDTVNSLEKTANQQVTTLSQSYNASKPCRRVSKNDLLSKQVEEVVASISEHCSIQDAGECHEFPSRVRQPQHAEGDWTVSESLPACSHTVLRNDAAPMVPSRPQISPSSARLPSRFDMTHDFKRDFSRSMSSISSTSSAPPRMPQRVYREEQAREEFRPHSKSMNDLAILEAGSALDESSSKEEDFEDDGQNSFGNFDDDNNSLASWSSSEPAQDELEISLNDLGLKPGNQSTHSAGTLGVSIP